MKHHKWEEIEFQRTKFTKVFRCTRCKLLFTIVNGSQFERLKLDLRYLLIHKNCDMTIVKEIMGS